MVVRLLVDWKGKAPGELYNGDDQGWLVVNKYADTNIEESDQFATWYEQQNEYPVDRRFNLLSALQAIGGGAVVLDGSGTVDPATFNGQPVVVNSSDPETVTLSDDFPIGTVVNVVAVGTGAVSIEGDTDTVEVASGFVATISGQYLAASAVKFDASTWVVFGSLAADA